MTFGFATEPSPRPSPGVPGEGGQTRISVITPSFNLCDYLRRTADSILSQSGPFDLEWIVIDGGSSDGTVEFLRCLVSSDPRVHLTSEPDRGQSHAINKGLARATGDVVTWLNADDLYAPGALAAVADAFSRRPDAQWLVGRYEVIDAHDRPIRPGVVRYKERKLRRYRYRTLLRENFIPQPAVFWRRAFGEAVGPLDESLNWTMDYDLWLRMGRRCDPLVIDALLARFRLHETSKSGDFNRRQFDEGYEVARRYFDGDWASRVAHRLNVEKIVWAYRAMKWAGR
jgi:glycosyltransferase involved in cell wall biosynthesis